MVPEMDQDQFAWDESYDTGNEKIDRDHKQIFMAANLLHKAIEKKAEAAVMDKCLELLLEYTVFHFNREIAFFKSISSTVLKDHQAYHDELFAEITTIRNNQGKISDHDLGLALENWITNRLLPHIMEKDIEALNSVPNPFANL